MIPDAVLLSVLKSKSNYQRFEKLIKETTVAPETWAIIKTVKDYFSIHLDEDEIDWTRFSTLFFHVKGRSLKEDKAIICRRLIEQARDCKEDETAAEEIIKHYVELDYASRIGTATMDILSGSKDITVVEEIYGEYCKEVGRVTLSKEDLFASTDLTTIISSVASSGFKWRLQELNRSLGDARQGDFMIFAARPETGKTTLIAQEMTHWASQLTTADRPIIWVNNEERSDKVMLRAMQSYFAISTTELFDKMAYYKDIYDKEIGKRLLILNDDDAVNNVGYLDKLFTEYNPSAIVFDQLDKVHGFNGEVREDLRLGKLYFWAREQSKKYGPTVAISQIDGSGEGQKWLNMQQLRGSKTDKAGEADAIVTIGRTSEDEYKRYIHVPKNKLFGGSDSVPSERHGHYEVSINPEIARYVSVY